MNLEELKTKLSFVVEEETQKSITVYVTSPAGLQLFNMVESDLYELMPIYIDLLKSLIMDKDDLLIGDYSTTSVRDNMIYLYDLANDTRTQEMNNMAIAGTNPYPPSFSVNSESLERINGFYVVIKDTEHRVVFYKKILPLDKTYCRSSLFFGIVPDNTMFERKRDSLLRVSPGIQMLFVDDDIILIEMSELETALGLDAILQKEAASTYESIMEKNLVTDITSIKNACEKPSLLKKLRHALSNSRVKDLSNDTILKFAREQTKLKFKFNVENTKFDIDSKAAATRFIKLLDDDYLFSRLTSTEYDSEKKYELQEVIEH